jgi:hypothetical protein
MVRKIYQPSPNLLGLCYYGLGSAPGWWEEFDLLRRPEILRAIEPQLIHDEVNVVDTPVTKFKVMANSLNVRQTPSTNAPIVASLSKDVVINTNGYVDENNYRWRRRVDGGFCAEYLLANSAAPFLVKVSNEQKVALLKLLSEMHESLTKLSQIIELID